MEKKIEQLIEDICFVDPSYKTEIETIEKKYCCEISCSIEKHNALQHTYFYEFDFGKEQNFYVEIESGISNGTKLISAEWGVNTLCKTKTIKILKDIVLDSEHYEDGSLFKRKSQAVLDANKNKLFEFERKNNYDNYVTGGHSKMELDLLLSQLHLEYIYEEEEVDCTFV